MSSSDFMVYITQDAVPASEMWLHYILEPFFLSDKVAAVLGRQIPRPDCNITVKREVSSVFSNFGSLDSISLHRGFSLIDEKTKISAPGYLSDVNAAYRRNLLVGELPFPLVDYAEDQAIGEEVLTKGYIKAYAPQGSVFHSHNFSVRQYFYRKYDETLGLIKNTGARPQVSAKELVIGTLKSTIRDWMFLLRDKDYSWYSKLTQFIKSPFYNLSVRLAILMASSSRGKKNSRLSLEDKLRSQK
jgi:rhamnosyltransferase